MALFFGCLVLHVLLAQVLASPRWVPDLTLGGLLLAVGRAPRRWLPWSGLASLWAAVWAVRAPGIIFLGYVGCGWIVSRLSRAWDMTDLRIQSLVAGIASLFVTGMALWVDQVWRAPVMGWASVHVAVTTLAVAGLSLGQRRAVWRGRASRSVS